MTLTTVANGCLVACLADNWLDNVLFDIVAGCLILACITDCTICSVYQFIWWPAWSAEMGMVLLRILGYHKKGLPIRESILGLVVFVLLQEYFFARMYGRADCHAFVTCALAEWIRGMDMIVYPMHMAVAFGLLALVQGACGNISRTGRLKVAKPFLPYITAGFWIVMVVLSE
ncbi:MAG: hypothetical protein IJ833_00995 [Lachnospiraceae bacterium]|nr:hypothetical protein [Lachnospiraceae bacterium]